MIRIYISGPMTGLPQNNYPAFNKCADDFRRAGFAVVNPAELAGEKQLTWQEYMRQDLRWLLDCDAITMLPGWKNSKGAQLELAVAQGLGLKIFDSFNQREVKEPW